MKDKFLSGMREEFMRLRVVLDGCAGFPPSYNISGLVRLRWYILINLITMSH